MLIFHVFSETTHSTFIWMWKSCIFQEDMLAQSSWQNCFSQFILWMSHGFDSLPLSPEHLHSRVLGSDLVPPNADAWSAVLSKRFRGFKDFFVWIEDQITFYDKSLLKIIQYHNVYGFMGLISSWQSRQFAVNCLIDSFQMDRNSPSWVKIAFKWTDISSQTLSWLSLHGDVQIMMRCCVLFIRQTDGDLSAWPSM